MEKNFHSCDPGLIQQLCQEASVKPFVPFEQVDSGPFAFCHNIRDFFRRSYSRRNFRPDRVCSINHSSDAKHSWTSYLAGGRFAANVKDEVLKIPGVEDGVTPA